MRAADPDTVITAGKVWGVLGRRADCGGCMPLFLTTLRLAPGFAVPDDPARPPCLKPREMSHEG